MKRSRQVVIGSSAAGVSAAFAMRRAGFDGAITIVGSDPHEPYERPPLSKSLLSTGDTSLKPIFPAQSYLDDDLELILGVGVRRLDTARQTVELADGRILAAGHVLLATGVGARRLPIPGADLANVMVLRDAADAGALASRLTSGGPLLVIGGGFIGLELAAAARDRGLDVTVVEQAALPLVGVAGRPIAELVRQLHEDRGVRFVLGTTVEALVGTNEVEAAILSDGSRRPAATVVVGVGVVPRVELAEAAGIEVDRYGIVVDRFGATTNPWVSAAGDVASQPHPALDTRGRIEHWDVALRHGAAVGASAVGVATEFDALPYAWSDQFGLTFQIFGRPRATDQFVLRAGATQERFIGFWMRDERVGAVMGLNAAREVAAARRLIESGLHVPAARLLDAEVDLRRLPKQLAADLS
ncbi:NAD(P)/FAD-dependent oxidoreductase [Amycolatopsis sp. GM8]|uniref:NAD(P)/FAD-dependent oxidoreductase n=1 Tax=Amycolatopsis sp. GM8 TaxID=2896530 RepID=UPI001F2A696B|nr:FAD-dependent oxidoreductase [Amycolatopsis sp. GM8]